MQITKTPHLAYRTIKEHTYIINVKTSMLHELDETGTFLWNLIDSNEDPDILAKKLYETYDLPSIEQAKTDVLGFVNELTAKGMVEIITK